MSLAKCWECGGRVSTFAEQCPHCGAPASSQASEHPDPEVYKEEEEVHAGSGSECRSCGTALGHVDDLIGFGCPVCDAEHSDDSIRSLPPKNCRSCGTTLEFVDNAIGIGCPLCDSERPSDAFSERYPKTKHQTTIREVFGGLKPWHKALVVGLALVLLVSTFDMFGRGADELRRSSTRGSGSLSTHITNPNFISCATERDLDRLIEFAAVQDKAAFERWVATSSCHKQAAGRQVYIDERAGFGKVCVRPVGETRCEWVPVEAID